MARSKKNPEEEEGGSNLTELRQSESQRQTIEAGNRRTQSRERRRLADAQRDRGNRLRAAADLLFGDQSPSTGERGKPSKKASEDPEEIKSLLEDSLSALDDEFRDNQKFRDAFLQRWNGASFDPKKDSISSLARRDPAAFAKSLKRVSEFGGSGLTASQKQTTARLAGAIDSAFDFGLSGSSDGLSRERRYDPVDPSESLRSQAIKSVLGTDVTKSSAIDRSAGVGSTGIDERNDLRRVREGGASDVVDGSPASDDAGGQGETVGVSSLADKGVSGEPEAAPILVAQQVAERSPRGDFFERVSANRAPDEGAFEIDLGEGDPGIVGTVNRSTGETRVYDRTTGGAGAGVSPSSRLAATMDAGNMSEATAMIFEQSRGGLRDLEARRRQDMRRGSSGASSSDLAGSIEQALAPQTDRMSAFAPGFLRTREEVAGDRSLSDEQRAQELSAIRQARASGGRQIPTAALGPLGQQAVSPEFLSTDSSGQAYMNLGPSTSERVAGVAADVEGARRRGEISGAEAQRLARGIDVESERQLQGGQMGIAEHRDTRLASMSIGGMKMAERRRGGVSGGVLSQIPHALFAQLPAEKQADLYFSAAVGEAEQFNKLEVARIAQETELIKAQLDATVDAGEMEAEATKQLMSFVDESERRVVDAQRALNGARTIAWRTVSEPRRMDIGGAPTMNVAEEEPMTAAAMSALVDQDPNVINALSVLQDAMETRNAMKKRARQIYPEMDEAGFARRAIEVRSQILSDAAMAAELDRL